MKYLKNFENNPTYTGKYKVGDYVKTVYTYGGGNDFIKSKIIEINTSELDSTPYHGLLSSGKYVWLGDAGITRKLDPDEIEKFELELVANKYNL